MTPERFETKSLRAQPKKAADCSRRVLATGGAGFDSRSIFDPVIRVKGQIYAKSTFFQLYISISQKL